MLKIFFITNAGKLAARMRRRAESVTPTMVKDQKVIGEEGIKRLKYYSSARAYKLPSQPPYPYSTNNPSPPLPPYFINVQTGQLREGWRYRTIVNKRSIGTDFYNVTSYSKFMFGTRLMIERPILQKVLSDLEPLNRKLLTEALINILKARP